MHNEKVTRLTRSREGSTLHRARRIYPKIPGLSLDYVLRTQFNLVSSSFQERIERTRNSFVGIFVGGLFHN